MNKLEGKLFELQSQLKTKTKDAHLKHGDTCQLRQHIFDYWVFSRS